MRGIKHYLWGSLVIIITFIIIKSYQVSTHTPIKVIGIDETEKNLKEIETTTTNQKYSREYNNNYEAEVQMNSGVFFGVETIDYVHEFQTPTQEVLIKLPLNTKSKAYAKEVLEEEVEKEDLAYGEIYITDVLINGEKVPFTQEMTDLWIFLPELIENGYEMTISLAFHGQIPQVSSVEGSQAFYYGNILPQMGVFNESLGWEQGYDYTKPNTYLAEMGDYSVSFTVKDDIEFVASGQLVEEQDLGDEGYKYFYKAKKIRDFGVALFSKDITHNIHTSNGLSIQIYTSRKLDIPNVSREIDNVMTYYKETLGTYPYRDLKIIDWADMSFKDQYPRLIVMDVVELGIQTDQLFHRLGRQWTSSIMQHHPVRECWLSEGLAEYIAISGYMSLEGKKQFVEEHANLKFFYQTEKLLGEEDWRNFLRTYYKKSAFNIAHSEDFIKLLFEQGGEASYDLFKRHVEQLDIGKDD